MKFWYDLGPDHLSTTQDGRDWRCVDSLVPEELIIVQIMEDIIAAERNAAESNHNGDELV